MKIIQDLSVESIVCYLGQRLFENHWIVLHAMITLVHLFILHSLSHSTSLSCLSSLHNLPRSRSRVPASSAFLPPFLFQPPLLLFIALT